MFIFKGGTSVFVCVIHTYDTVSEKIVKYPQIKTNGFWKTIIYTFTTIIMDDFHYCITVVKVFFFFFFIKLMRILG